LASRRELATAHPHYNTLIIPKCMARSDFTWATKSRVSSVSGKPELANCLYSAKWMKQKYRHPKRGK
jgi:hypothetical protein